jgi:glycosyltransferase involved in cell wall biosynthesis
MARIRILYFISNLTVGGSERQLSYLVTHHDQSRFEPVVWCQTSGPLAREIRAAGIEIHRHPLADNVGFELEAAAELIRRIAPSVFVSFSHRYDACDVLAATAARVPRILTMRGNLRHWDRQQRVYAWERLRNAHTHLVIANSRAVAGVARCVEELPARKVRVIYNGVPCPGRVTADDGLRRELGIPAGAPLIGSVGNLREVKGHDVLLRAFKRVLRSEPDARLVVAGANYEPETGLEALWNCLGLRGRAHFLGCRLNVDRIYRALDLYVHSSHSEGMPNAVLEAMAAGLPVVATAAGGTGEAVVHGKTGLLVPVRDARRLAAAMLEMLQMPERRARMGSAGRLRFERSFRAELRARAFEKTFEELLSPES